MSGPWGYRDRDLEGRAFDLGRPAGVVAQPVDGAAGAQHARHAQRLAVLDALDFREQVGIGLDHVGELQHQVLAVDRPHRAPRTFERRTRGAHRAVDQFGAAFGYARNDLARGGIVDRQAFAAEAVDEPSVNEGPELAGQEGRGRGADRWHGSLVHVILLDSR